MESNETILRDLTNSRANVQMLRDQVNSLSHDLFHANAEFEIYKAKVEEYERLIASDTVYTLLRYGVKSPSSSGVDEYNDDCYQDLYNKSVELRAKLK